MEKLNNCQQEQIKKLQDEAKRFLTTTKLSLNGIIIEPKEVEVYYYEKGIFEDNSVHQNELQQHNKNHFYIHRWGIGKNDQYKGGNYPGIDFVVSDTEGIYYTYLIRSAVVKDGVPIVGPHKVLMAIKEACGLNFNEIESVKIENISNKTTCDVLFSNRINLGKRVLEEYRNIELRAVVLDEGFRKNKYPAKENLIIGKIQLDNMSNVEALAFAKEHLGYVPSSIKK